MMSPSPACAEQQFQSFEHPTNLDRGNRCGLPRSAHGPDWTCTAEPARRAYIIPLISGALLTLLGVILSVTAGGNVVTVGATRNSVPLSPASQQAPAPATLAAIALVIGVVLLVTGAIMARRSR
jgi:hypothetical protein